MNWSDTDTSAEEEDEWDEDEDLVILMMIEMESNNRNMGVLLLAERTFIEGGKKPTTDLCWITLVCRVSLGCIRNITFTVGFGWVRIYSSTFPA